MNKAGIEDIALSLRYDDGIAIYLNATEVLRTGLRNRVPSEEFALVAHVGHGKLAEHFAIPHYMIRTGENVLAAEVHQVNEWSADLRFDVALSSNVVDDLRKKLRTPNRFQRLECVRLLRQLRSAAKPAIPQIKGILRADDEELQKEAFYALVWIAPTEHEKLSPPKALLDEETRSAEAARLQRISWKIVRDSDRSEYDYATAYRNAFAASILQPDDAVVVQALGVSLFRVGRFRESMVTLAKSSKIQGVNSIDLIVAAMAEFNTDQPRQWKQWIIRARRTMKEPNWSENEDANRLFQEARMRMAGR